MYYLCSGYIDLCWVMCVPCSSLVNRQKFLKWAYFIGIIDTYIHMYMSYAHIMYVYTYIHICVMHILCMYICISVYCCFFNWCCVKYDPPVHRYIHI